MVLIAPKYPDNDSVKKIAQKIKTDAPRYINRLLLLNRPKLTKAGNNKNDANFAGSEPTLRSQYFQSCNRCLDGASESPHTKKLTCSILPYS